MEWKQGQHRPTSLDVKSDLLTLKWDYHAKADLLNIKYDYHAKFDP